MLDEEAERATHFATYYVKLNIC